MSDELRRLEWMSSSMKDLSKFPGEVIEIVTAELHRACLGLDAPHSKIMKGFKGHLVMEIALRHQTNAYRCVYVVTLPDALYVLHCFMKKSKRGIATPKPDMDIINQRLKAAVAYSGKTKRS